MKTVLAAINFSCDARYTLKHAIQICQSTGADLKIFHAITSPSVGSVYGNIATSYNDLQGEEAKEKLELVNCWMKELNPPLTLNWTYSTRVGRLSQQLKSMEADLVVMGPSQSLSKGKKGKIYQIMKDLNKPVLFVNEKVDFTRCKKLLICLDYLPVDDWKSKVGFVKMLAENLDWDIHILHVSMDQKFSAQDASIAKKTNQYLKGVCSIFHQISSSEIPRAIQTFIDKNEMDVLTMIPRNHSFLEQFFEKSVTKSLLGVDIPLIVLQP